MATSTEQKSEGARALGEESVQALLNLSKYILWNIFLSSSVAPRLKHKITMRDQAPSNKIKSSKRKYLTWKPVNVQVENEINDKLKIDGRRQYQIWNMIKICVRNVFYAQIFTNIIRCKLYVRILLDWTESNRKWLTTHPGLRLNNFIGNKVWWNTILFWIFISSDFDTRKW